MNGAVSVGQAATPLDAPSSDAAPLCAATSGATPEIVTGVHNDPHLRIVLSVVIATYNRLDSLLWLLDDLSAQTDMVGAVEGRPSFEVIVVDDGGAVPVLPELASRDYPFALRALRRANGGPGAARDSGIRRASGEIIVILDDDMVISPTFLAAHELAHRGGAEVVLGNILPPRAGTLPLFERFHLEGMQRFAADYREGRAVAEGTRLCTGNVSFRRVAYESVDGFDLALQRCEDRDLGIRLELAGKVFAFTDEGWSEHRSDHEDVATWRRRSRLFGELDSRIADKHPDHPKVSPWAFLPKLPAVARPLLILAAVLPGIGQLAATIAYRLGEEADKRAHASVAMAGASTCYAFEYFSGVGIHLRRQGGPRAVLASERRARWARRRQRQTGRTINGAAE